MAALDELDLETLDFGLVEPNESARIVKGLKPQRLAEFKSGPQLSLTMAAPDFLGLVSDNASGPTLFFTRELKVKGDIRLAGGPTYFFDVPKGVRPGKP
jgi:hypothetical protein